MSDLRFSKPGKATGDHHLIFKDEQNGEKPIDLELIHLFGSSPKTILNDKAEAPQYAPVQYEQAAIERYLEAVLQLEAVACKDWLTNKVDRCVTGKVAKQQTAGEIQLPLNNLGVTTIDYFSNKGVATSIGHAPVIALIDAQAGSRIALPKL